MDYLPLLLAFLVGLALGGIYFGGLWLTVRLIASAPRSGFWLLISFVIRAGLLLAGIFFVAAGRWERIVACLVGVMVARFVTTRLVASRSPTTP